MSAFFLSKLIGTTSCVFNCPFSPRTWAMILVFHNFSIFKSWNEMYDCPFFFINFFPDRETSEKSIETAVFFQVHFFPRTWGMVIVVLIFRTRSTTVLLFKFLPPPPPTKNARLTHFFFDFSNEIYERVFFLLIHVFSSWRETSKRFEKWSLGFFGFTSETYECEFEWFFGLFSSLYFFVFQTTCTPVFFLIHCFFFSQRETSKSS
jgi:hypothetical protein